MSNSHTQNILIIDDDPALATMHEIYLNSDGYKTRVAEDGMIALKLLASDDYKPDLILMDVEMPVMNGYAICHKIKANPTTQNIPVIFVSSHDKIDDIMAGYDSGGIDYLTKPLQKETLLTKVELALNLSSELLSLELKTHDLTTMSMSLISNLGEQAVIIDFLKKINPIETIDAVGESLLSSIKAFGLEGLAQIHDNNVNSNLSQDNRPFTALELRILEKCNKDNSIQRFQGSLCISYQYLTLFVKNMPKEEELAGRYRDHLAMMVAAVNDKIKYLISKKEVHHYIKKSYDIITDLEERQQEYKDQSVSMMENLLFQLEDSFISWGLSEQQEKKSLLF